MRRKKNLPIPNFDQIIERYARGSGEPVAKLAKESGISYQLLRLRLIDAGEWQSWTEHPADLTEELPVDEIVRRYRDDRASIPQIVEELRGRDFPASPARITRILDEAGIDRVLGRRRRDIDPQPRKPRTEYQSLIKGKERELAERFLNGEKMSTLCEESGVPIWTLPEILKDGGYLPNIDLRKFQRRGE